MSDVIKFNTEELIQPVQIQKPKTFDLVPENHPILREVMPEFDFVNPPVNPSDFASTMVETCKQHRGIERVL